MSVSKKDFDAIYGESTMTTSSKDLRYRSNPAYRERRKKTALAYYKKHRKRMQLTQAKWRKKNKEKLRQYALDYRRRMKNE